MKRVRLLSGRTETPEGGVVVRSDANFSEVLIESPEVASGGKRQFIVSPFDQFMNE